MGLNNKSHAIETNNKGCEGGPRHGEDRGETIPKIHPLFLIYYVKNPSAPVLNVYFRFS